MYRFYNQDLRSGHGVADRTRATTPHTNCFIDMCINRALWPQYSIEDCSHTCNDAPFDMKQAWCGYVSHVWASSIKYGRLVDHNFSSA